MRRNQSGHSVYLDDDVFQHFKRIVKDEQGYNLWYVMEQLIKDYISSYEEKNK